MNQFTSSYSSHFLSVKYLIQSVIFLFIFVSVLSLLINATLSAYERIQKNMVENRPASEYFLYHNIAPTKDAFKVGEVITFSSYNDTYRPLHFYWNDRLWCDLEGDAKGYHLVGRHTDDFKVTNPKRGDEENPSDWNYTGALPDAPGICYLISVTTAVVEFDIPKEQRYIGKQFHIIP